MKFKVRKAISSDAIGWCYVRKEAWLLTYPNAEHNITVDDILEKDFDTQEKIEMWQKSFNNPDKNIFYLTALNDDEVIGLCIGEFLQDINELCAIYVLPKYHGLGVGKLLMNKALKKLGIEKDIKLNVVEYNKKAIDFYKKFGFKIKGPISDDFGVLPNGKRMPEVEMIKKVICCKIIA